MDNPYYEKLVNASLRFVSYRPRSEKELTDFLVKKLTKYGAAQRAGGKVSGRMLVDKVVARMGELGYVDDRKFTAWWIEQRTTFKPKGARLIALELGRKGISKAVINDVLGEVKEGEEGFDEASLARKAIAKKLTVWTKLPTIEQKKKVYTFLAQRGFSFDTIGKLIDEMVKKDYNGEY